MKHTSDLILQENIAGKEWRGKRHPAQMSYNFEYLRPIGRVVFDVKSSISIIMRESKIFTYCEFSIDRILSYVYTLRLIGPISYLGQCDLMVRPFSTTKVQRHFLTNAFCTYITCTNIRNRPD